MFRALEKCHVPWAAMPPCHTQPTAGLGPDPVQVPVAAQGPVANTPPSHTFTLLFGLRWVCTVAAIPYLQAPARFCQRCCAGSWLELQEPLEQLFPKKLADPTLKLCKSQMKSFVLVRAM